MPWYINPVITCNVLNRIANRHPRTTLQDLNKTLEHATQLLWSKQERYYKNRQTYTNNNQGSFLVTSIESHLKAHQKM